LITGGAEKTAEEIRRKLSGPPFDPSDEDDRLVFLLLLVGGPLAVLSLLISAVGINEYYAHKYRRRLREQARGSPTAEAAGANPG